jgi:hypothetical protein
LIFQVPIAVMALSIVMAGLVVWPGDIPDTVRGHA